MLDLCTTLCTYTINFKRGMNIKPRLVRLEFSISVGYSPTEMIIYLRYVYHRIAIVAAKAYRDIWNNGIVSITADLLQWGVYCRYESNVIMSVCMFVCG